MFEKTLADLVRGIRAHKGQEHQFIAQCMTEIKKELKQDNVTIKANAVSKLTYLQMLGYDISWAAFNVIEVMSCTKFTVKRIGYLAAAQSFHEGLDVVMLTTNMIRKDISTHNQYDASLALNGLSCFMTPDLARDLANDVLTLTASSRPYLRKKAILVMYKVFLRFPDALRPAFPRLKDRLDDPDTGVQSAAVSVICELARKNPRNYLSLAPTFFKLMTSSTNNWMLIKIIKLFGSLTPLEPRLGKKLVEPLTSLIHSTTAMSLLYECISTVVTGIGGHGPSLQLCVSKLRLFIEDADQNLKYLGLLTMSKIMQSHPRAIHQLKDLIVECLDDRDDSIRLRALDLISGMVSKKNLMEIVKKLMLHMDQSESASYRDEVLSKIIQICSQGNYQHITNFEWYITVLVEMTRFESTRQGKLIASQMLDVTIRVKEVRPFSVRQMATILENTHLFTGTTEKHGICEVLYAASWIVGEFSEHISDPRACLDVLLSSKVTALPGHIQAVFVQNIVKLYASILVKAEAEGTPEAVEEVGAMLVEKLPVFIQSGDLEVQERACCILQLMKYIVKLQSKGAAVADELTMLFAGDLNPVAAKAQRKVPVPEGLDLDKWINEPPSDSGEEMVDDASFFLAPSSTSITDFYSSRGHHSPASSRSSKRDEKEDEEEIKKRREQRRQEQMNNPHYLKSTPSSSSKRLLGKPDEEGVSSKVDVSSIPVSKLELGVSLILDEPKSKKDKKKGKKKKRKGRKGGESSEEDVAPRPAVDTSVGEMPEGAVSTEEEEEDTSTAVLDHVSKALNQNLDVPLRDDEVLPVRKHRQVAMAPPEEDEEQEPKKKGKEKHKKKKKSKESKAAEEGEGEKKPKEHRKKRKGSKKHSRRDANKEDGGEAQLIDVAADIEAPEDEEPLESPLADIIPAEDTKEETKAAPSGELDDLEFWLSRTDASTSSKTKEQPPAAAVETRPQAEATAEGEEGETKRKKKREKKPKKEKRGSKKHKSKPAEEEGTAEQPTETAAEELLGLDLAPTTTTPKQAPSSFKLLAEDENLKMTYEVRANPLYSGQVTVAVVFSNQTPHQLVSMEFNVLDSLNTKMERPMGSSVHDGIKVPFQLPPGTVNECQFIFYVQSFLMPQKLRGTATYMIKSDEGTASDKLDFTISLPCSAFICPIPCSQQQFASLLSSGGLCNTQTIKAALANTPDFDAALSTIAIALHLTVLEHIDNSASLYGCSIANQHVCLLVKSGGENMLTINAKGSDSQLVSNLLDEIRAIV